MEQVLGSGMNNVQLTPNFNLREFECHEGGAVRIDTALVLKLQKLRDMLRRPVVVLSGYRTPEYNKKVGGATNSYHMKGQAADIQVQGVKPADLAKIAEEIGFDGIGIYPTFVHVDVRGYAARWHG